MKEILEILAKGFDTIGKLSKNKDVDNAAQILDAIEAVWEAVDGAVRHRITPDEAHKELARLRTEIDANDAAADAALDSKFPEG
jgi:hypothetical protein